MVMYTFLTVLPKFQTSPAVRASTRPAQRKGGIWSGARAVKQTRRGDVRAPAVQNRGVSSK